jgi:hypothetical protein
MKESRLTKAVLNYYPRGKGGAEDDLTKSRYAVGETAMPRDNVAHHQSMGSVMGQNSKR